MTSTVRAGALSCLLAGVLGLALPSCFSLDGLHTFPCASDDTCPEGFHCAAGTCRSVDADSCVTDEIYSTTAYGYKTGLQGFCSLRCDNPADINSPGSCPTGMTCVNNGGYPQYGDAVWMCVECQTSSDCGADSCCAKGNYPVYMATLYPNLGCQPRSAVLAPEECMP